MAFLDNAALADMIVIDPGWQCLLQRERERELFACCILAEREGQGASNHVVAFVRFIIL